jgi:hypothetical protein
MEVLCRGADIDEVEIGDEGGGRVSGEGVVGELYKALNAGAAKGRGSAREREAGETRRTTSARDRRNLTVRRSAKAEGEKKERKRGLTVSMRQEKGQSTLQSPLRLCRAEVGVDDDLGRIVKVAKLSSRTSLAVFLFPSLIVAQDSPGPPKSSTYRAKPNSSLAHSRRRRIPRAES